MSGWLLSPADGDGALKIEVDRDQDAYEIGVRGVLDLSTAERFETAVNAGLRSGAGRVRVDIDGLEFIDSTGLATILRAARRVDGDGRLKMTRGTGEVAQLFRLTALDLVLPFE